MKYHAAQCTGSVTESKVREEFPDPSERLKFTRPEMAISYPMVCYWDFETFSKPVSVENNRKGKSTTLNYKYEAASYSLVTVLNDIDGQRIQHCEYYDGENPVPHFLNRVLDIAEEYLSWIRSTNNMLQPTAEELARDEAATDCFLCGTHFGFLDGSDDEDSSDDEGDPSFVRRKSYSRRIRKNYHHNHSTGEKRLIQYQG